MTAHAHQRPSAPAQPLWKRSLRAAPSAPRMSAQARATLIRQMATLVAVMPISDAIATLARQPANPAQKAILQRTNRALQSGSSLAAALPASAFPEDIRATIAAGEASGRLPLLLSRLADTLEADVALRSKLLAALAYPLLLLVVALGVILAMLIFVVPGIAEQLTASGQTLPLLTRLVLGVSAALKNWWWLLMLLLAVSAGAGLWWVRQPANHDRLDHRLLTLPLAGNWIATVIAVRWSRLLATMLTAGLPLAEALTITAPTLGNAAWREATMRMARQVRSGASLSASLSLLPRPPALLLSLTQSGEAAGRLAPLLESAAQSLDRQLQDRSRTFLALAEPLIIVMLGAIVALIILAVLLPILQLNTLAGAGVGAS